jgi:hypothetical protein
MDCLVMVLRSLACYRLGGTDALLWYALVPYVVTQQLTFCINSIAHTAAWMAYKTYASSEWPHYGRLLVSSSSTLLLLQQPRTSQGRHAHAAPGTGTGGRQLSRRLAQQPSCSCSGASCAAGGITQVTMPTMCGTWATLWWERGGTTTTTHSRAARPLAWSGGRCASPGLQLARSEDREGWGGVRMG